MIASSDAVGCPRMLTPDQTPQRCCDRAWRRLCTRFKDREARHSDVGGLQKGRRVSTRLCKMYPKRPVFMKRRTGGSDIRSIG